MNKDFIEIVKVAQMGDNRAFEALYNMTKDSAYFIALSITKNEQDALDIMQDSYIKAFQSIDTLNSPELFDNWVGRIVANTSKNYINKKKPMLFSDIVTDALVEWNDEEFNKEYLPHESVDTKETSRLLMEIINGLSEDKRLCILMYYYQDMSVKEIAEVLELPVSTVKYKLLSARAEIKKGVEDLEKRGTKLYGVFPFALFPAQFKNIETEFLKAHSSPAYSSLNFSAQAVQAQPVASQAVNTVVKKGFLSTVVGKITVVLVGVILLGGGITATVVGVNNASKSKSSDDVSDVDISNTSSETEEATAASLDELELSSLTFNLDGVTYSLPCDFSEFKKNGWSISEESDYDETETISAFDTPYDVYVIEKAGDKFDYVTVSIRFMNTTSENAELKDCKVGGIIFTTDHSEYNPEQGVIEFPGGLVINQLLTEDDILNKFEEEIGFFEGSHYADAEGNFLKYSEGDYQEREGDYQKVASFLILEDEDMSDDEKDISESSINEFALYYEYSPEE